ncbi:MAG: hypothetical protein MI922_30545 [Bacteroidales bacterium]|nr:hypothetical protein [Bacteroidales bacterium]
MNVLSGLKSSIGERVLLRNFRQQDRKIIACNVQDASSIGVVFDATQPVYFEIIRKFVKQLESTNNDISVLGYIDDKKLIDHYLYRKGFDFITKKDLNWYDKPENQVVNTFINTKFDILFDLSLSDVYPIQYMLAMSKASLKVGKYSEEQNYLDIMIDIENERAAMQGIRQEVSKEQRALKQNRSEFENIVSTKTTIEIELSFLINELMHYLAQLKK